MYSEPFRDNLTPTEVETSKSHEANVHSIRALEKRIKEGTGDIIELKRARNSLLNISARVPPEILPRRRIRLEPHPRKGWPTAPLASRWVTKGLLQPPLRLPPLVRGCISHPGTLGFWLRDWKKRHHYSGATPLDMVLDGGRCIPDVPFDESPQDAVSDRVMQDTIRQVYLTSNESDTLASIISALTPDGEDTQNDDIESIVWRTTVIPP